MTRLYVDTSALVKLVRVEAQTSALRTYLRELDEVGFVSSELTVTELRRVALRMGEGAPAVAERLLQRIEFRHISRAVLDAAGVLSPAGLRSLDAIHLTTALELRADIDGVIAYDVRLGDALRHHGLIVIAPGSSTREDAPFGASDE